MTYTDKDLRQIGADWLERIKKAEQREDMWCKSAEEAEAAYLCDSGAGRKDDVGRWKVPHFNIVHSNIETIVPSIYNSTPRPEIRSRHDVQNDTSKAIAGLLERAISTQIDDDKLNTEMEALAQDAFLAGRGVIRLKFDADVTEVPGQPVIDPETGMLMPGEPVQIPINERVIYENVSWRDFRMGPAKRWKDVPWVCFRHEISAAERERLENEEITSAYEAEDKDEDLDCTIWEIWCKETMRVYFVIADSGKILDIMDDPLGLSGFFPMPPLVQPITPTGKMTPVCPYSAYKHLAEELDTATRRINNIMDGLKVRGLVASAASDIEALANASDNTLVTAQNLEQLAATGGLDKAVLWWPIETAVAVLNYLYQHREQTKQAIYEVTGISDIVRGASNSGETATAQQIKTQWGSLRVKKMQRMIERCVRSCMLLTAEIMSLHFSTDGLAKAAGMPVPPEAAQLLQKPLDHYRIDVETDSTIRADLTKSRSEMSEFLNGTAQFFGTMAPIAQQAPESASALIKLFAGFSRQFIFDRQSEDAIDELVKLAEQAAANPPPNPEAERMKAEMQMKQQEMQLKARDMQQRGALEVQKLQLQNAGLSLDNQIKQRELGIKENQLILDERKAEVDAALSVAELEMEEDQQRAVKVGG